MDIDDSESCLIRPITCVVLAGGKGLRALATGDRTPKVLRCIGNGESALANAVYRALAVAAEVIVAVGPMRTLLSTVLPSNVRLIIIDDDGNGNGNALVSAANFAKYETILVINADTVNDIPYGPFIDSHLARGIGSSILLTRWPQAQNPNAYLVSSDGLVIHSLEDRIYVDDCPPPHSWSGASTGVLIFSSRDLRAMSVSKNDIVQHSITPSFLARKLLWAFDGGYSATLDLGTPERIAQAHLLPRSSYLRRD